MKEEIPTPVKKLKPKEKAFYVSNKDLYEAYCDWHKEIIISVKKGKDEPQIPKFVAESIMKICHRLSYAPNFINYSYREDMVGDAIENCIKTAKNFNPAKSTNPFSFITTIAFNAFIRRIKMEKTQSYIKGKLIEELPIEDLMNLQEHDEDSMNTHNQFIEFLRDNNYTDTSTMPGPKKKAKEIQLHEENSLENFTLEEKN